LLPEEIRAARDRLAGIIRPTPLIHSATLDRILGAQVRLKPENLQKTGSFKIRGAYNRLVTLSDEQKSRGVVAASAGNHGQALAYAATAAGVTATIVMPTTAAIAKIDATRSYGQSVVLEGVDYQAARAAATKMCDERGASFIDAYDDPYVIAGQGTVGMEIADEVTPDVVIVPVGGGGLIAGIAAALTIRAPGAEVMRGRVRRAVTVDDFEIGEAVLLMLERLKLLAEGAGAAALAGALKLKDELKGKTVVLVVSGGNIDINLLDRIIGHGLVKVGRLFRVAVDLRDRPGELGKLVSAIAATGANVRAIDHDRTRRDVAIGGARVMLELETRGPAHIEAIREQLKLHGYQFEVPALG